MDVQRKNQFSTICGWRSPHVQTLWSPLLRRPVRLLRQRERLELPDSDFVDLDWCHSTGSTEAPLAVLFHGLSGSTNSHYILGMQSALARWGWQSVAMNFRGCSGRPNRLPRGYHSGDTADIDRLLKLCRSRFPQRHIVAIGYSLGGNALCKWLGEQGDASDIDAAVIVSAPYELARCATRLDQGFSRVYRRHLINELVAYIERKKALFLHLGEYHHLSQLEALGSLSAIKSFWQFDDQVIAPLHGFDSAQDYYERSSARQFVPAIKTPCLLIHAEDDPFMPKDVAPTPTECPESVERLVSPEGGHVGFVQGHSFPWRAEYWLEKHIPAWLEASWEKRKNIA